MTTHAHPARVAPDSATPTWPVLAAAGLGLSVVLTAIGTFWDVNGNDPGKHDSIGAYLIVVAIAAVATAMVYGLVVRTATARTAGRRGLVLAVLAVLTDVVFWAGLPAVFATAAIACALLERSGDGRFTNAGRAMLGLSAVSLVAATAFAFVG